MTARIRRHPDLRLTEIGGEGVVLHLGSRRYFSVSESGLVILEALTEPRTIEELVVAVMAQYEVTPEKAAQSVADFVDRCRKAGLLLDTPEP